MKYLLVLGVLLFAIWLWRHNRQQQADQRASHQPPQKTRGTPPDPALMVVCAECGVHLAQHEAISGQRGLYCSEAHRRARES